MTRWAEETERDWNDIASRWGCIGYAVIFVWFIAMGFVWGDDPLFYPFALIPIGIYFVGVVVTQALSLVQWGTDIAHMVSAAERRERADDRPTIGSLLDDLGGGGAGRRSMVERIRWAWRYARISIALSAAMAVCFAGAGVSEALDGPRVLFPALAGLGVLFLAIALGHLAANWQKLWQGADDVLGTLGLRVEERPALVPVPSTSGGRIMPLGRVVYGGTRHARRVECRPTVGTLTTSVTARTPRFDSTATGGRFEINGLPGPVVDVLRDEPVGDWWDGVSVTGDGATIRVVREDPGSSELGGLLDLRLAERIAESCDPRAIERADGSDGGPGFHGE